MSATVAKEGPAIGPLHEVRAAFASADAMASAVSRLERSGFDRADLSLPEPVPAATPETSARPVDTESDARQARTLHVSGAAAVVALAAAGIVIASGGSIVWAVVAAILGALVAGGIVHLMSTASNEGEQIDRERKAAVGALILSVRAPTREKQQEAATILRASGGTGLEAE
ncbi:MAG TPA: hypothetical protein VFL55_23925 [Acetobacteraceae bacterium]|nr:hypothetical protein [Acetobacteraceae bacterium]